jgi:hypothetical protein
MPTDVKFIKMSTEVTSEGYMRTVGCALDLMGRGTHSADAAGFVVIVFDPKETDASRHLFATNVVDQAQVARMLRAAADLRERTMTNPQ